MNGPLWSLPIEVFAYFQLFLLGITGLAAIIGKLQPAHGPLRGNFQRLLHQIRRCRGIAALVEHLGIIGATIGDDIAGGKLHRVHR